MLRNPYMLIVDSCIGEWALAIAVELAALVVASSRPGLDDKSWIMVQR